MFICKACGENRNRFLTSPERCVSDRFELIAAVTTAAVVTTRHDQCPVETTVGTKGTSTIAVASKADGRSITTRQYHLYEITLAPQCSYAVVARHNEHRSQFVDSEETKKNVFFRSSLRHHQSAVLDISSCSTRLPPTKVRIPGILDGDNIEHQLIIDSATDIPCTVKTFTEDHEKLTPSPYFPIPPNAISLHSADGTPLEILGCIRFTLKLGNKSLPVEALVLPHLGPDAVLIDISIMKAFGAKLDWVAERLAHQDGNDTIPTTHMRRPITSKYCSIITQTSNEKSVPVWVFKKYVIPAAHEALIRVFSTARP